MCCTVISSLYDHFLIICHSIFQLLLGLASHEGIAEMTDEIIIGWANKKVQSAGKSSTMSSFRDPKLKSGVFLLELVGAIEPRAVNPELVTRGKINEIHLLYDLVDIFLSSTSCIIR